jgi:hypothetical protein
VLLPDQAEGVVRREALEQDEFPSSEQCHHRHTESEAVRERQLGKMDVVGTDGEGLAHPTPGLQQAALTTDHSLRCPCGARREEDQRRLLGRWAGEGQNVGHLCRSPSSRELGQ